MERNRKSVQTSTNHDTDGTFLPVVRRCPGQQTPQLDDIIPGGLLGMDLRLRPQFHAKQAKSSDKQMGGYCIKASENSGLPHYSSHLISSTHTDKFPIKNNV